MYNEKDLAYLAGIIDGEGGIQIARQNRIGGKYHYVGALFVAITDPKIPHWLNAKFGGAVYYYPAKGRRIEHWRWQLRRIKDIKRLLRACYPYLIAKKEQVDIFCEMWKEFHGWNKWGGEEFAQRDKLYLRIKGLYCKKGKQSSVKKSVNSVKPRTGNTEPSQKIANRLLEGVETKVEETIIPNSALAEKQEIVRHSKELENN